MTEDFIPDGCCQYYISDYHGHFMDGYFSRKIFTTKF